MYYFFCFAVGAILGFIGGALLGAPGEEALRQRLRHEILEELLEQDWTKPASSQ